MKVKLLIIILITSITSSCQNKEGNPIKENILHKGHLVYDYKISGTTLGFDFKFNKESVRVNEYFIYDISSVTLIDKKNGEVLHLNKRSKDDAQLSFSSIDRMILLERGSAYGDTIITKTKEFKNLLGYKCNKTIMSLGKQVEVILWTTDKIKTGITFPNSPLSLNETALEYEMKILGQTNRHYKIKSIEDIPINDKDFEQNIPDEYKLIVPAYVYSLSPFPKNNIPEKLKSSIEYPSFKGGNEEVKKYFIKVFSKLEKTMCLLKFTINKSGDIENINISGCDENHKVIIQNELKNIPKWIPGKVNGVIVNSELTIYR